MTASEKRTMTLASSRSPPFFPDTPVRSAMESVPTNLDHEKGSVRRRRALGS
jgi:hypothetical protein